MNKKIKKLIKKYKEAIKVCDKNKKEYVVDGLPGSHIINIIFSAEKLVYEKIINDLENL